MRPSGLDEIGEYGIQAQALNSFGDQLDDPGRVGRGSESHSGFAGGSISFFSIAGLAGDDAVLVAGFSAS